MKTLPEAPFKTEEEIIDLINNWNSDAIWDLHKTEGFERYSDRLLEHETKMIAKWKADCAAEELAYAESLGIANNLPLARFIASLEARLEKLEKLENKKLKSVGF